MDNVTSTNSVSRAEAAKQRYLASLGTPRAGSRPTDHVVGKEVITQSSKKPLVVTPLLGVTPKDLSDHRADTHRKLAHWVADKIAYVTGPLDGITDGLVNGIGELMEDGAFFTSKLVHGAQHGWIRGKFPTNQQ